MILTYHGGHCIKVSQGNKTIVVNPHSKTSSFGGVKGGADVALISLHHPDFAGVSGISGEPFVIDTPGEYEVGDITVRGFGVVTHYDGVERYNTIYQVHFEDIVFLFVGALENLDIDQKILGNLDDIDVLVVPIGGDTLLETGEASKLATKLEAHAIIPVEYTPSALKAFQNDMESSAQSVDKFTFKKKDVADMQGEVVVVGK